MELLREKTLFVFVDESGNLDFGAKGTKFYVLAAVATTDPIQTAAMLQKLKYRHLRRGEDVEFFHASEDLQYIRNEVTAEIQKLQGQITAHCIFAQKNQASQDLREGTKFYTELGAKLMRFIIEHDSNGYDRVVVIFDQCLRGKKQEAFLKAVKPQLKNLGKPYEIFFHRVLSDFNGQIADYFAWAKYVSLERGEMRPIMALKDAIASDFDLFAK